MQNMVKEKNVRWGESPPPPPGRTPQRKPLPVWVKPFPLCGENPSPKLGGGGVPYHCSQASPIHALPTSDGVAAFFLHTMPA